MSQPIDPRQTIKDTQHRAPSLGSGADETVVSSANLKNNAAPEFGPPNQLDEVGVLGPYRIVKELGRGGMGAVYAAIDSRLDRKLALKVMLPAFAADKSARERFLREARAAAQITHDNVVTVYEADERDGVPYIAMQFLQGHPLDEYLKRKGNLSLSQVLRIGRETAAGLAAAHRIGLVHRDVKPANLWLEAPNGRVKVLDFGLARSVDADAEVTRYGGIVGTPAYMSPEQARGLKIDHRTDLFSLGVLLYELTTGRLPFQGPTTIAVLMALGTEEPTPVQSLNPNVPDSLATLIHQLLRKAPEERPATADEVAKRLREIAESVGRSTDAAESPSKATMSARIQMTAIPSDNPFANLSPPPKPVEDENPFGAPLPTGPVAAPSNPPAGAPQLKTLMDEPPRNPKWPIMLAGGFLLPAIVAGIIIIIKGKDGSETKLEVPDGAKVTIEEVDGKPKVQVDLPKKAAPPATSPVPPAVPAIHERAHLVFDGVAGCVESPSLTYDGSHPITLEAWVNVDRWPDMNQGQMSLLGWNGVVSIVAVPSERFVGTAFCPNAQLTAAPTGSAALNKWQHVAFVWNGKRLQSFVDGQGANAIDLPAMRSVVGVPGVWADHFALGGAIEVSTASKRRKSEFFKGKMTEIRVSKSARYTNDFKPAPRFEPDAETMALFRCDEGAGTVLKDSSGNRRHGKLVGATWGSGTSRAPAVDADRKVAQVLLEHPVQVQLQQPTGRVVAVRQGQRMPEGPLRLTGVIYQMGPPLPANYVDRVFLPAVAKLHSLEGIQDWRRRLLLTEAHVRRLADMPSAATLTLIDARAMSLNRETLALLKRFPLLMGLGADASAVDDELLGRLWQEFPSLDHLYLDRLPSSGRLTADGLRTVARFSLRRLALNGPVPVDRELCRAIAAMPNIDVLQLVASSLDDDGLIELGKCPKLILANLDETRITDAGLEHLKELRSLQWLSVTKTKVTAAGARKLAAALPQCEISYEGGFLNRKK